MQAELFRSEISGTALAPSSKSAMQRYVAGTLLAEGVSEIYFNSLCDDSRASISIAESLGAEISVSENVAVVKGGFKPVRSEINCGESGLSTRMFSPIIALHDSLITINGTGSVMKRPIRMVERPLIDLGVKVNSNDGYLPLGIQGPMKGGNVVADGSVSSQFITGLLMALPLVKGNSIITVNDLVSKPYIDLTLSVLKEFGIEIKNENYYRFLINGEQRYKEGRFRVEGDWSGAAFLLVMGAIAGEVTVEGLDINSAQADKAVLTALKLAGAEVIIEKSRITVKNRKLAGFEFDISDCPDLAPPLSALALACNGKTIISGTARLTSKESNRSKTLEDSLSSIGGEIRNLHERIEIVGGSLLNGGVADSFNDHRIAMALATAALYSGSPVLVNGIECINKSYPGFFDDYSKLGGKAELL